MKYSLLLVLIFATVTMAYVQRANLPSAALIAAKPKNDGNIIDDAIGFVKDLPMIAKAALAWYVWKNHVDK